MFTREQQERILAEVSRAPSVHNVQPARWRFDEEGVTLLQDRSARLPAADPTGRDVEASLGASFEGMCLALSRFGLGLTEPLHGVGDSEGGDQFHTICTARFVGVASLDPLAEQVSRRRSWRGAFAPVDAFDLVSLQAAVQTRNDAWLLAGSDDISCVARLNDDCSWEFMRDPSYHGELHEWMRLSSGHPRWSIDGLNADCLAMSGVERRAASVLFRPSVFRLLKTIGVARALVGEAGRVRSAAAAIAFHRPEDEPPFENGRAFYRLWLEITAAGMVACPMSSIADSASGSAELRARCRIPPGRRVVNVLRVGKAPAKPPKSPRRAVSELLIESPAGDLEPVR
jgi:nitroreductase